MALNFHPEPGMVLICDFTTGFRVPEIVKRRPVVVISPRRRRASPLCTVVALSTTAPSPVERFHHRLDPASLPGRLADKETWAKGDLLATVSLARLDRVRVGRNKQGKRLYLAHAVTAGDLSALRQCVQVALGLQGSS